MPALEGFAVLYDSPTAYGVDGWAMTEVIAPGALDDFLTSGRAVFCCVNHSERHRVGGKVTLTKDRRGVRFRVEDARLMPGLTGVSPMFTVLAHRKDYRRSRAVVTRADLEHIAFCIVPQRPWYPALDARTVKEVD